MPTFKNRVLQAFLQLRRNGVRWTLIDWYERLLCSLKDNGAGGSFRKVFVNTPEPLYAPCLEQQPHPFDLLHGTDTGGFIPWVELIGSESGAVAHTTGYQGVPPSTFLPAVADVGIRFEDFTFVDMGCGKGRALLLAARFPFRRLFGVEIEADLCEIARANVALNPDWKERVSIIRQDARTFTYPEGPLLIYLFNPFLQPALRRVVANLEKQFRDSPRPIYLLYADGYDSGISEVYSETPTCRKVMTSFPIFRVLSDKAYPVSPEEETPERRCNVFRYLLYSAGTVQ